MRETLEYLAVGILLFSSGCLELIRGFRILSKRKFTYNVAVQIRLKLIEFLSGTEAKKAYEDNVLLTRNWTFWGILGIVYGLIAILGGSLLLFLAFT
jgi:hypothetical protein